MVNTVNLRFIFISFFLKPSKDEPIQCKTTLAHHIPSSRTHRNDVVGVYRRLTQKYPYICRNPLVYIQFHFINSRYTGCTRPPNMSFSGCTPKTTWYPLPCNVIEIAKLDTAVNAEKALHVVAGTHTIPTGGAPKAWALWEVTPSVGPGQP